MTISTLLADAATPPKLDVKWEPITHALYDNDGVNIDSETAAMRVMDDEGVKLVERYVPDHGMEQDHIYKTYPGTSTDKIVEALIKKFSLPVEQITSDYGLDIAAIKAEQKEKLKKDISDLDAVSIGIANDITIKTIAHFKEHLTSIPGVAETLPDVRAKLGGDNVALCTTSREDRMDVSLDEAHHPVTGANAGLGQLFPKGPLRISGYEVSNKYDLGFKLLEDRGFRPSNTVVFEDSESGVEKAKKGRPEVRVVGTVAAQFYPDKELQAKKLFAKGADIVISDMRDQVKAIDWLNAKLEPSQKPTFSGDVFLPAKDEKGFAVQPVVYRALTAA